MFGPILLTLLYISGALSATLGPCKKEDSACISQILNKVFTTMIKGVPSRGVDSSDPIFQEIIEVELPLLKYKLTNTTTSGFKDCVMKNNTLNLDTLKFNCEMECPSLSVRGNYEISGNLILIAVEGKGTFNIVTSKYWGEVDADLTMYKHNHKTYLKITNFKQKIEAMGPIKFDFKNLFNGRQDLSDAVHKFAHENWKQVASLTDRPIFTKNLKVLTKNLNQFLKFEPLEEVIVDF